MISDAVVVTYKPNFELLKKNLLSLIPQINRIFICDNTEDENGNLKNEDIKSISDKLELVALHKNLGIAEATNRGIQRALDDKAAWVLTSDQDTIYPADYLASFEKNLPLIPIVQNQIAAVAPLYYDRNTKMQAGFVFFDGANTFVDTPETVNTVIFQSIASGMMINASLINQIGMMKTELFIDWVDLEWCWRVNSKGFKVIGCKDMKISHCLGDNNAKIFGKVITLRNPIRHYYILRNCVYLSKNADYLPVAYRKTLMKKAWSYFFGYTYLGRPHFKNFKYLCRALNDGKKGIMGKITLL
jgi:rhamnosyltransferase